MQRRDYLACDVCGLIHLEPTHRLDAAAEHARYATHRNDPADERYRAFLRRLADPLIHRLAPGATGLDYGSGPGPTLSVMLEELGCTVSLYDPFFAPDTTPLLRTYDFITCSETAEHFYAPLAEFERLDALLKPGGVLAVMTSFVPDSRFEDWAYARDEAHACFYRPRTMEWIARRQGWALELPVPNVALFLKAPG